MTVNRTTLLDLPLPVTGTESGTWGDTTNNGLTQYLDIAIAGTLVLSTDADVTLTSTEGDSSATNIGATTAQYAILRWTATGSTTRNITALAQSKTYVVINATGGTQSIVLRGAGPTTGVTIISGEKALCVWNGSDFVKVSSSAAAGGSNTQVQYNSSGVLAGSSNMTFDGTSLTLGGNPTLSAGTANGVLYLNGSKVATSGSALVFDGTNLGIGTSSPGYKLDVQSSALTVIRMKGGGSANQGSALAGTFAGSTNTMYGFGDRATFIAGTPDQAATIFTGTAVPLVFDIATAEKMRLDTSGNLGIGTSSPTQKLDVAGQIKGTYLSLDDDAYLYFGDGTARIAGSGASEYLSFVTSGSERARIDSSGNLGLGGSAARATTAGSAIFNIFNGTAPVGTLTNGISLYSSSGEAYVMDAAGNATLFSPHDRDTNEWIFRSKHTPSGKVLKIDVERLLRFVNDHFGLDAVQEFIEP